MSRIEGSGGLGRMPVSKRSGGPWSGRNRLKRRRKALAKPKRHRTKPVSDTSPPPTPPADVER